MLGKVMVEVVYEQQQPIKLPLILVAGDSHLQSTDEASKKLVTIWPLHLVPCHQQKSDTPKLKRKG